MSKTIKGLVFKYSGCGNCPIKDCEKTLTDSVVRLIHTGKETWDNWGRDVRVFGDGDVVDIEIRHDNTTIYCAIGTSTLYDGISDYVDLNNFSEISE